MIYYLLNPKSGNYCLYDSGRYIRNYMSDLPISEAIAKLETTNTSPCESLTNAIHEAGSWTVDGIILSYPLDHHPELLI